MVWRGALCVQHILADDAQYCNMSIAHHFWDTQDGSAFELDSAGCLSKMSRVLDLIGGKE